MPGFLYFLNNATEAPRKEDLGKLGLAHAFSQAPAAAGVSGFACGDVRGLNGVILFDPERIDSGRAAFHAGQQTWLEVPALRPDSPRLFCGMYNDAPPSPGDLQRPSMLPGTAAELGDGKTWIVPIARSWGADDEHVLWTRELPRRVRILPDGGWGPGEVVPAFRDLWEIDDLYYSVIRGGATDEQITKLNSYGLYSAAAIVLAANYLVGPAECSLLGLLDTQNARQILDLLIQRQEMEDLFQKKMTLLSVAAADSTLSCDGQKDSLPITTPPDSIS